MRHRPCKDPSPAPLPEAIGRYMAKRYPHLSWHGLTGWPNGARVTIGLARDFWPVGIQLIARPSSTEHLFDMLYDRLTRAIDRKVKELQWTKPAKHSKP